MIVVKITISTITETDVLLYALAYVLNHYQVKFRNIHEAKIATFHHLIGLYVIIIVVVVITIIIIWSYECMAL